MLGLKYSEIIRRNTGLKKNTSDLPPFPITILSNIMVHYLKDILEVTLREHHLNPVLTFGDYDNIVQHSAQVKPGETCIICWEVGNIVDGLHFKIKNYTGDEIEYIYEKTTAEIAIVANNLKNTSVVLFNKFSASIFDSETNSVTPLQALANRLNDFCASILPSNIKYIDIEKVLALTGIHEASNWRDYYSSKTLYAVPFFKQYSLFISPILLSKAGKSKKALVFDCDNTLWNGILGEDGFAGINMSQHDKVGIVFAEVQSIAKSLAAKGVIIGICSKNNPEDVDEVLATHIDMILQEKEVVIKKVNWRNKSENLAAIAQELNIGLDSIVFIDDSPFEINLIKEELPSITTIQVPQNIYEYPAVMKKAASLFYQISYTAEDANKVKMYQQQQARVLEKDSHADIDTYLSSLQILLDIKINEPTLIPRIAQLTQKTNQFNLTTRRYSETDILKFFEKDLVLAVNVKDKYGDSGVTGLAIVLIEGDSAIIDTLLMSCRVLGRKIEFVIIDEMIKYLCEKNISEIRAHYIPSSKNSQVKDLYDKVGFSLCGEANNVKEYLLKLDQYKPSSISFIQVNYD